MRGSTKGEKDYGNFEEREIRPVRNSNGPSVHAQGRNTLKNFVTHVWLQIFLLKCTVINGTKTLFRGYSEEGPRECWEGNYLKTETGEFQKPSSENKRCYHCRYWAHFFGNTKDFWCRHRKEHMKNFHPSTRLS